MIISVGIMGLEESMLCLVVFCPKTVSSRSSSQSYKMDLCTWCGWKGFVNGGEDGCGMSSRRVYFQNRTPEEMMTREIASDYVGINMLMLSYPRLAGWPGGTHTGL